MLYVGNGTLLHKTKFISFPPVRGKGQWLTIIPEQKNKLESLLVQKGFLGGVFLVAYFFQWFFFGCGVFGVWDFFFFLVCFLLGWLVWGFLYVCVDVLLCFLLEAEKGYALNGNEMKVNMDLIMRMSRGRNSHNSKLILWYPKCLENVLSTLQNFKLH